MTFVNGTDMLVAQLMQQDVKGEAVRQLHVQGCCCVCWGL